MVQHDAPDRRLPVQEMDLWLADVRQEMGRATRAAAYHALRGVLTALRDSMPLREAYDLAARLPLLVRTLYFHGYRPSERASEPARDSLRMRVRAELNDGGGGDPDLAIQAVLRTMGRHLGEDDLAPIWEHLPDQLRPLGVEPLSAARARKSPAQRARLTRAESLT